MKQIIKNYSFDKSAKTVTFTDFTTISLDRLFLITNVTANTIIYQFNDATLGGTASGNVLTLTYNTSAMSNGDKLQIIYDTAAGDPTSGPKIDANGTVSVRLIDGGGSPMSNSVDLANDAQSNTGFALKSAGLGFIYNGTAWDRARSASTAAATTGMGIPAAGIMGVYNSVAPTITNGNYERLQLDSSGNLKVNIASGSGGGTQYATGAVQATPTGNLQLGYDGTTLRATKTAADGTQVIQGNSAEFSALSAAALNADLLPATDVSAYKSFSVHVEGTFVATITIQCSNDGTNWRSAVAQASNNTTNGLTSSISTGVWEGPVFFKYLRIRVTAYTSGSASGNVQLYTQPSSLHTLGVSSAQTGTWTVGSNSATAASVPANAFYMAANAGGNLTGLTTLSAGTDAAGNGVAQLNAAGYGYTFNGTSWDRVRSASSVAATTGTGLLGAGILGFDGTNFQRVKVDTNGNQTLGASTNGGYTPGKVISAATTNATSVKTSTGTIGYITASSINASPRYLKIYDKASAPTVGTDVPIHTFIIPGSASGAGTNIPLPPQGIACVNGIAIAITASATDADTTAVAAGEIIVNYGYK